MNLASIVVLLKLSLLLLSGAQNGTEEQRQQAILFAGQAVELATLSLQAQPVNQHVSQQPVAQPLPSLGQANPYEPVVTEPVVPVIAKDIQVRTQCGYVTASGQSCDIFVLYTESDSNNSHRDVTGKIVTISSSLDGEFVAYNKQTSPDNTGSGVGNQVTIFREYELGGTFRANANFGFRSVGPVTGSVLTITVGDYSEEHRF